MHFLALGTEGDATSQVSDLALGTEGSWPDECPGLVTTTFKSRGGVGCSLVCCG